MPKGLTVAIIVISAVVFSFLVVRIGGYSDYDFQGLGLTVLRLNLLMLWVMFVLKLRAAAEGDDLDEDWKRIDGGNIATGVYRGLEFLGLVVAGALLIGKI